MNREQFKKFQKEFYDEAHDLMLRKNSDYATGGNENVDAFANFAKITQYPEQGVSMEAGVFARFLDKVSRLSKLMSGHKAEVNDESIRDTAIDLANYASIMCAMVVEKQQAPPFPPLDLDLGITLHHR